MRGAAMGRRTRARFRAGDASPRGHRVATGRWPDIGLRRTGLASLVGLGKLRAGRRAPRIRETLKGYSPSGDVPYSSGSRGDGLGTSSLEGLLRTAGF